MRRVEGFPGRCRALALLAGLAALVGCENGSPRYPTPYQAFTQAEDAIPGGYIDRALGPDEYVVTFRGNVLLFWEDALVFAHRRAAELCGNGYETLAEEDVSVDLQGEGRSVGTRVGSTTIVRHHPGSVSRLPRARLRIRCK